MSWESKREGGTTYLLSPEECNLEKTVNHCNISMKHSGESTEFLKNTHLKGTVWGFI